MENNKMEIKTKQNEEENDSDQPCRKERATKGEMEKKE